MEIKQAVKAMSALAQESRLKIFRHLITCGEEGLPAGQIAESLGIPAATMSFHLKELTNAWLIDQHQQPICTVKKWASTNGCTTAQ